MYQVLVMPPMSDEPGVADGADEVQSQETEFSRPVNDVEDPGEDAARSSGGGENRGRDDTSAQAADPVSTIKELTDMVKSLNQVIIEMKLHMINKEDKIAKLEEMIKSNVVEKKNGPEDDEEDTKSRH